MAEKVRFHLDENVSNAVGEGLRRRGVDVTTTPELSLIGVSDKLCAALSKSFSNSFSGSLDCAWQ